MKGTDTDGSSRVKCCVCACLGHVRVLRLPASVNYPPSRGGSFQLYHVKGQFCPRLGCYVLCLLGPVTYCYYLKRFYPLTLFLILVDPYLAFWAYFTLRLNPTFSPWEEFQMSNTESSLIRCKLCEFQIMIAFRRHSKAHPPFQRQKLYSA